MPHVPPTLDADAVRTWSSLALTALGRAREDIDAINVYPVADGDTGTNLYLTAEAAAQAVEDAFAADPPSLADAVRAYAHGALIGARGNSGTILAQLLRGMAEVLAAGPAAGHGAGPAAGQGEGQTAGPAGGGAGAGAAEAGRRLAHALARAAESAYQAVAHPVEGTMLTVASAAARAAGSAGEGAVAVAWSAYDAARTALEKTPGQLGVLGRAGVVDAGGCGVVAVLGALWQALSGGELDPEPVRGPALAVPVQPDPCEQDAGADGPGYEVIFLLEAQDEPVELLRERLDALGDSLVVVGGEGLWNVHVHVDDPGAAVEAGIEAGRPYRIRITHFADQRRAALPERVQRAVVAVVPGEGLAGLCEEAGATCVLARPGEPPAHAELLDAIRRAHAREVVLLPNDAELRRTAAGAAEQARAEGVRVAVIPTRSAVQGLAALAVHDPDGSFDEDVVTMTSAAGATRYGELAVAERQSFTSAGICQAGDVLGLIEGDVALIGDELTATAEAVLARMLGSGGELVTLVLGPEVPEALAERLETYVRERHLAVDTVVYQGGRHSAPLLIGVE
ncbi:DAK2 domain-containing protein [Streptomyces sp. NPDC101118]|uniref:DAK2 domain-containing protein n=1 Tax=Streptomyces sp. NPDC101118 TaxID=3366109 RepID=UPI00380C1370